jgi:hypothetical protein
LLPVFAFTNDFFSKLEYEDHERVKPYKHNSKQGHKIKNQNKTENENELKKRAFYFAENYHEKWKNIQKFTLHDFTKQEWENLIQKVIIIHALAYNWRPSMKLLKTKIEKELLKHQRIETRLKLKLIVNALDMEQQKLHF